MCGGTVTLGTGIFLSAVILSVVALYALTRDRISWLKALRRTLLVLIVLGSVGGGAYYAWDEYQSRPRQLEGLWGIRIGDSEADVVFRKGAPKVTCVNPADPEWKAAWYEKGDYDPVIRISYQAAKVFKLLAYHDLWDVDLPSGMELYQGASSEAVIEHWGKPDSVEMRNENKSRVLSWPRFGIQLGFTENKLNYIVVSHEPDRAPWEKYSTTCRLADGTITADYR